MLYSSLKPGYKTQLKITPGLKQVIFTKMAMKCLTSKDRIKGYRHSTAVLHKIQNQDSNTNKIQ